MYVALFFLVLSPLLANAAGVPYYQQPEELRPSEVPALYEQQKPTHTQPKPPEYVPWLTGPLLAPSAHVVPVRHLNVEPYLYVTKNNGRFDSHWHGHKTPYLLSYNLQVPTQIGLTNTWDFVVNPQAFTNHANGATSTRFGDLPINTDYQVYLDDNDHWYPAVKLTLKANIPSGQYQKLNPKNKGTDGVGAGSWEPGGGFVFSRLIHCYKHIFLALRLSAFYTVPTPVHVKGLNVYGGAQDTRGKVFPGQNLNMIFGWELSLSQRWVLAMDTMYTHVNKNRFSGNPGYSSPGVKATMTAPSSEQFVLAPAIEYNMSANLGFIAGPWFTIAGRNATEYCGGIIAFNYYL